MGKTGCNRIRDHVTNLSCHAISNYFEYVSLTGLQSTESFLKYSCTPYREHKVKSFFCELMTLENR